VEANARGLLRIIFVTKELQLINAAFMHSLVIEEKEFREEQKITHCKQTVTSPTVTITASQKTEILSFQKAI